VQKQHREKKTLDRRTHLYNYQQVLIHTETKTFTLIIETYDLYSTLIMEREIVKISVKISLPATEVKEMYLNICIYICICMCIYVYTNILHFPPYCQQMCALVCIHGLYFVHTLKFQSFVAARVLLQLWLQFEMKTRF